jgi:pimeloyl-ACP methyl ester carboxylesterase
VLFFQLPWLPEAGACAANWRAATRAPVQTSRPGTFPPRVLARYRTAWSQPGAYSSMLNWYRAALRHRHRPALADTKNADPVRICVPTLVIWGVHDRFVGQELAGASVRLCDNGRVVFLDEATHWVQHEESERVNQLLGDFLGAEAG